MVLGSEEGRDACSSTHPRSNAERGTGCMHCGSDAEAGRDGGNASLWMLIPGEMQGGCMAENACGFPEGDEGSRSPGCILIKPLTSG
jgi:hypothetical protein